VVTKLRSALWAGVAVAALAYMLMALIKAFLPMFIVLAVLVCAYSLLFRRKW
jgi:type III secretory pathway component EscV